MALAKESATRSAPSITRWKLTKCGQNRRRGVAIATWPDWWGFKYEAWDGIPWNAVISAHKGVRVALKSDSEDRNSASQPGSRQGYPLRPDEDEALKAITLNPAWIIGVDERVGSLTWAKTRHLDLEQLSALFFRARR